MHDGEGNLTRNTEDVIIDGEVQKSIITEYLYDSRNRVTSVVEAIGDPIEKRTLNEYLVNGLLAKVTKPDGVILFYELICWDVLSI